MLSHKCEDNLCFFGLFAIDISVLYVLNRKIFTSVEFA